MVTKRTISIHLSRSILYIRTILLVEKRKHTPLFESRRNREENYMTNDVLR